MKLMNFTLLALLLCTYASGQPGNLDGSFNSSGTPGYITTNVVNSGNDYAKAIAVHGDGRIVVAAYNENNYFTILRYTTSGALDNTFGSGGIVTLRYAVGDDAQAYAVSVLSNNKILVAGFSWGATKDFALLQLEENGSPDLTFGTNGWAITPVGTGNDEGRSISIQSDNKIIVAGITNNGTDNDFALVRYNSNGGLDNTFGIGGKLTTDINGYDLVESMAIQSDGKIVVGGTGNFTGAADFAVVRYNSNGSLDNSFGSGGITTIDIGFGGAGSTDHAHSLAIQPDGKIILAGQTVGSGGGNDDIAITRLTSNGLLDAGASGFDGDGILTYNYGPVNTDEEVQSIVVQNDGKILVSGSTDGTGATYSLLMLRYNADGSLDPTFGPGANGLATADLTTTPDLGYAMAVYGTRIYVAGTTGDNSLRKQVVLAAFSNSYIVLPLTLLQFWVEEKTDKVVLRWQTTNEENVGQFIIERSIDGINFKAIANRTAVGNSKTLNNYSYTDQSALTGNNYYRLLIQDIDGNYKYSKVVVVKFGDKPQANVQLFPCPARDVLQVQLPVGLRGTIYLRIIDLYGRVLKTNNIASDGSKRSAEVDVRSFPNGVYVLEAYSGNKSVATNKFIKQ